jgi:glycosyltransferase involved in cell wall biosynthesis
MKVSVIPTIRDYPWGAPGHCMGTLVEELLEAGHKVQWFVAPIDLGHPEVARLRQRGAMIEPLPPPPKGYVRWARAREVLEQLVKPGSGDLEARVSAFGPDHIFVNQGGTWDGVLGWIWPTLQEHRGRYSLICHLNMPRPVFAADDLAKARALANGACRMFFNSAWVHELAKSQIASDIPAATYFQLPLRWYPDAPLPWPHTGKPRLATVGRMDSYHKGLDLAIDAVSVLNEAGVALEFHMVGNGPDAAYLQDYARFRGVKDHVRFSGWKTDLAAVWSECELMLLPSRFEGLAVSMLEAMSFGRPVLRTPYGGCSEWIEDGVNGFVCPAAEVGALVETLKRALAVREHWREMGLAAHGKIIRELDPRPARVFLEALRP